MKLSERLLQAAQFVSELEAKQQAPKTTKDQDTNILAVELQTLTGDLEDFKTHVSNLEDEFRDALHEVQSNISNIEEIDVDEVNEVTRWYQNTDISELEDLASQLDADEIVDTVSKVNALESDLEDIPTQIEEHQHDIECLFRVIKFALASQGIHIEAEAPIDSPDDLDIAIRKLIRTA